LVTVSDLFLVLIKFFQKETVIKLSEIDSSTKGKLDKELADIKQRYLRRENISPYKYNPLNPAAYMINQEKERILIKWLRQFNLSTIKDLKLLEIGCGSGYNLLQFIKLGFSPHLLMGNELIPERINAAKRILPSELILLEGDALNIDMPDNNFDIVFQSMVFSSILNNEFQNHLANKMWDLVKPGGGVLWYDFVFNNPKNKDVRGIKLNEVKLLFPQGKVKKWKLTLAPPLAGLITKIHPSLYTIFNSFPFLKTHILCWIKKT